MSSLTEIRKIDNTRTGVPWTSVLSIFLIIAVLVWFFRGGSFRLYASAFFGLYYLTNRIWISVVLIGILQNIIFLPLRFIGLKMSTSIKNFEDEIDTLQNDDQYLILQQKVKKGDFTAIFYILNFILNAIAFFSAGRIFLINFYTQKLDPNYLYSFIPYPRYPLQGTDFYFPFFNVNQTVALDWKYLIYFWLGLSIFFAILKLFWRFLKPFLSKNKTLLRYRINYNRLLITLGGIGLTTIIVSALVLRHIPTDLSFVWLIADLTRQNNTMNVVTAVGTFLTTVLAGYKHLSISAQNLANAGISQEVINRILKSEMRQSFKNGLILGTGAYLVTNHIPCAFELSVATFELLYILSPFTFDRLLVSRPSLPVADTKNDSPIIHD